LTIIDIVENPAAAPMAILGLLLGGRMRSPKGFADMAGKKRRMNASDLAKMGPTFNRHDDTLQRILQTCGR